MAAAADLLDLGHPADGADIVQPRPHLGLLLIGPLQRDRHEAVVMLLGLFKGQGATFILVDREDHVGEGHHVLQQVQGQGFGYVQFAVWHGWDTTPLVVRFGVDNGLR